jgi:hypothetical protein
MSKKTVIFVGPSLPRSEVSSIVPEAMILPPAEQGDVDYAYRQLGAEVILLIDGIHTTALPVWHKEILGALSSGVRFLGAASMGALRAVECEPWGMEPIGEIASWFQDGYIDGDDEVCLAHGDESTGYRALSVPMVNIRASVLAAQIPAERKREILDFAKGLFYPDRVWQTIFSACELTQSERAEILSAEVDLKAADAMQACYALASLQVTADGRRKAKHCRDGYGEVFRANDAFVPLESGKRIRLYEIAGKCSPQFCMAAFNRILALEYCKSLGLQPREKVESAEGLPYWDLSEEERVNLANQEHTLARGREWLIASGHGFHDVPAVLNFLRATGVYEQVKEG